MQRLLSLMNVSEETMTSLDFDRFVDETSSSRDQGDQNACGNRVRILVPPLGGLTPPRSPRWRLPTLVGCIVLVLCLTSPATAADPVDPLKQRDAIQRGLAVVQQGAKNYPAHRDCFSCHHQTLPLLAMRDAKEVGLAIDAAVFEGQTKFTRDSFTSRRESLKPGQNVGGRGLTVGYGLWTLQIAGAKPDETSRAMVAYLLRIQEPNGSWKPQSYRPPMSESVAACTVLAAYGVQQFAEESQKPAAKSAGDQARTWLLTMQPACHEDRVFRLWGLVLLHGSDADRQKSLEEILKTQNADGSWSQQILSVTAGSASKPATVEIPSAKDGKKQSASDPAGDAYATGQTLWVLKEAGVESGHEAVRRGLKFLVESQHADGSWHVVTRAKPVQVYFDNGDPHGHDQFISISATGWATAALARWMSTATAARETP